MMSELLHFTDAAVVYIKEKLLQEQGLGFRVSIKKTGCSGLSYTPAIISEVVAGDLHFKVQEELPVYLDPACLEYVRGLTVDFIEEQKPGQLKQKKLIFINPNEKSRCGCGESFHV